MSSKLAKLIVVAVAIAALLRIQLAKRRIAEKDALAQGDAGSPSETPAARMDGPDTKAATRAELYQEARRRGVRGRSKMTKAQLEAAVSEGPRA